MTYLPDYLPWHPQNATDAATRITDPRVSITGAEFAEWVDALAEQLAELGVGAGDVVATSLPNRAELLVTIGAAWRLGAAVTPMNPTFTAAESSHQIGDSGAAVVITTDEVAAGPDLAARFPGAQVLGVGSLRRYPTDRDALPAPATEAEGIAFIIYTSGSTGRPKGVLLDHRNVDAMSDSMRNAVDIARDAHALTMLPLFHTNALHASFLAPFRAGGQLTILERFEPASFARAVAEVRPTYFSGVPAIYSYLLSLPSEPEPDFSSLRFAICGAAPASIELINAFQDRYGVRVLTGYGLTEGTCASTFMRQEDEPRDGSVGRALPDQQVRICDGSGGSAPAGVAGEVLIKGPNVMRGYLGKPEETAQTIVDGWLRTGDIGVLDEEGFLTLVDRVKDLIIRGGENLYPSEIEAALTSHPSILEAAVVGAPHEVLNEIPVAFVTATPGHTPDIEALHAHVATVLAKVKRPTAITVLEDFPRNPVGKVCKPTLRTRAANDANA